MILLNFTDHSLRHKQVRDRDDQSASTLTDSRHISMRPLPIANEEINPERITNTVLSRSTSEHNV